MSVHRSFCCVNLKREVILRVFLSGIHQGSSYNGVCEVLGLKKLFFPPKNVHDYCVNNELHACILIWNYSVFSSLGKNELCWF